jgi:hypothetical protein
MTRLRTVLTCLTAIVFFSAGPVTASLTVSHVATDAEMLGLLSDTLFVGEGRIGDGAGAATFEVDLGGDTGNPAMTAQYDWPNGTAVPWTLSYDGMTHMVTFTVDNITLQYVSPLNGFTDVFVRSRAVNTGSEMRVNNLVLDGNAAGDASDAIGDGLDILWISGGVLADGFVLTGQATMSWTGDRPTQSRLAFQIKIGTLATVYVERATWGQLKSRFSR